MKIQFLTYYYQPFLDSFYSKHVQFKELSYSKMLELLLNQFFADTGAAHYYFNEQGNESFIIIANCEPLQKKWAHENNVNYTESGWEQEIALAQVKQFKPDVFYLESIFTYFGQFVKEAKSYCKIVSSWISTPFPETLPLNNIDILFSSTPEFVNFFKKAGLTAHYMLPGFDERVLTKIKNPQPKTIPFSFIGGWSDVHLKRKVLLKQFASATPIQIWGYGYKKEISRRSISFYSNLLFSEDKKVLKAYKNEIWGLEMYDVLQKSLITLNMHEALLNGNVGNMRMFEASGVGTMLLNDDGHNLSQLFEVDKEIVVYKNFNEALEKYHYYSKQPDKAIEIGINAQKRTLKDYNYRIYVSKQSEYLKSALEKSYRS